MNAVRSWGLVAALALTACGRSIELQPVSTGRAPASAALSLASVRDARAEASIGRGRHEWLRLDYEVDTDADVADWLGSYLRASLQAHAHGGSPKPGALDVTIRRFDIREATWARGVAELDVRVRWRDGDVSSRRMTVVTTELMGEDGGRAWEVAANHLAGWAAEEVARWARAEGLRAPPPAL